jgi:hypothetical protein
VWRGHQGFYEMGGATYGVIEWLSLAFTHISYGFERYGMAMKGGIKGWPIQPVPKITQSDSGLFNIDSIN